ncbi:MAG: heme NO-binding domain-containing protein [Rhodoferax sp.]
MYGLVNRALEELVRREYGDAQWERIKAHADVDIEVFIRMDDYPDDISYRLVASASTLLGIGADDLLRAFGRHWTLYTGREGYGALLDSAGSNLQEVLGNLNDLHVRVGLMYPQLRPPAFRCSDVRDDGLVLHYYSQRAGLAPMVIGLVEGLGKRFGQDLRITPQLSRSQGDDHDSFDIRIL